MSNARQRSFGDVAFEVTDRAGPSSDDLPVYGVDRKVGLTSEPKYQSKNLQRYKHIVHGMFAYNPMRLNIGSIGYCFDDIPPGLVSPDYVVFACNLEKLLPKFCYYHTKSKPWNDWLSLAGEGSVRERIYFRKLAAYQIRLPPVTYQQAAVEVLSTLDDKTELNRRMNETLVEMARALFRDWFVDFGPTRRQMEGATDPAVIMGHAFPPEKAATLAPLFPAKLGDDGLPEGWKKRDLRSALTLNYGKALTKKARRPGPFNVFGSGGVSGTHDTALAKGPSIIVGRKGTVGSLYWTREDFYAIDTVFYVTSDYPMVYCHRLLETLGLETMNTDAAVPGLNRDNAYRQEFAFGGDDLVDAYAEFVGTLAEKSDANQQENQTLAEMRDLLLPKLMSGEIRLKDVEAVP
ncbi:MAG: restriction endonuclease subunit S [Paracoccaceae bacterium]